jgi:hypothetical protein
MKNVTYYNAGLIFTKRIMKDFSMNITFDMLYIPLSKGESYSIDLDTGERSSTVKKAAGIKTWVIDMNICFTSKIR